MAAYGDFFVAADIMIDARICRYAEVGQ